MKDIVEVGNVLSTISSRYKTLTNSEKLVADVVIQRTPEVLEESVIGLAEMAGVGEATVIRFCRKLGFKGFQGFKMILAAEMMQNNSRIQRENAENSSAQERLFHMQEAYRQAVDETVRMLDLEKMEEACAAILSCKKLLFFGVGASRADGAGGEVQADAHRFQRGRRHGWAYDGHAGRAAGERGRGGGDLLFRRGHRHGGCAARGKGKRGHHHLLTPFMSRRS